MEEVVDWSQFWDHLNHGNVNHALDLLPSILYKNGTLKFDGELRLDILSTICYACKTDEIAFYAANIIVTLGYVYQRGCSSKYRYLAVEERWNLFHYLMLLSGAYYDPTRIRTCIEVLDQRNIDPFLDRGVFAHKRDFDYDNDYEKFHAFRTTREKARIASIALIRVGKRRRSLDVMRVISRVVWSERCDEKWLENN